MDPSIYWANKISHVTQLFTVFTVIVRNRLPITCTDQKLFSLIIKYAFNERQTLDKMIYINKYSTT